MWEFIVGGCGEKGERRRGNIVPWFHAFVLGEEGGYCGRGLFFYYRKGSGLGVVVGWVDWIRPMGCLFGFGFGLDNKKGSGWLIVITRTIIVILERMRS